ncbi:MAG TPA: hypothetical protein VNL98_07805 [Gemmatimonadales bacterium]|nr:hypothetical protein [Gemmatimonadales bacterium]
MDLDVLIVFGTMLLGGLAFSPIGRAVADRLRGKADHEPNEELEELRDQVAALRAQVAELAERQDFTERLLAQVKKEKALPGSGVDG